MKIAFIGSRGIPARYGGIETSIEQISKRLVKCGMDVVVYGWKNKTGTYSINQVKSVNFRTLHSKHLGTLYNSFLSTIHACLIEKVDVIIFVEIGPAFFRFIPAMFNIKFSICFPAIDARFEKWNLVSKSFLKLLERFAVRADCEKFVVSKALQQYFIKKYALKLEVIPNGANIIDSKPKHQGKFVLFLNRLVKGKGLEYLLEAYESRSISMKLVIAGEGPLARFIPKNPLVDYVGYADAAFKSKLFSETYVFVLPSDSEGMSNSLLEAMSYGCCVLVSDTPENKEVIGKAGFTFKAGDSEDLKNNLNFLIKHPQIVKKCGLLARKRVSNTFSLNKTAEDYAKFLKKVVSD
jgi:glycosyltransferase involved in cell wall biosynthesis